MDGCAMVSKPPGHRGKRVGRRVGQTRGRRTRRPWSGVVCDKEPGRHCHPEALLGLVLIVLYCRRLYALVRLSPYQGLYGTEYWDPCATVSASERCPPLVPDLFLRASERCPPSLPALRSSVLSTLSTRCVPPCLRALPTVSALAAFLRASERCPPSVPHLFLRASGRCPPSVPASFLRASGRCPPSVPDLSLHGAVHRQCPGCVPPCLRAPSTVSARAAFLRASLQSAAPAASRRASERCPQSVPAAFVRASVLAAFLRASLLSIVS